MGNRSDAPWGWPRDPRHLQQLGPRLLAKATFQLTAGERLTRRVPTPGRPPAPGLPAAPTLAVCCPSPCPGTDLPSLPAEDASVSFPTARAERGHSCNVAFLVWGSCVLPCLRREAARKTEATPSVRDPRMESGSVPVAEGSPTTGSCHAGLFCISLKKLSSENASSYSWGAECFPAFSWMPRTL